VNAGSGTTNKEENVRTTTRATRPISRFFALAMAAGLVLSACSSSATSAPTSAPSPSAAAASTAPAPSPSAAAASTVPAASPSPAAELEGTIVFLHKYSDPRYSPYFDAVAAAYMAAHPKITIEIQAESDQGVKDKLRVLAASKQLPDIYFSWAGDFSKKFVRGGLAKDLTADVTGAWKDTFLPAALDAYTYGGKLYGVPITLDAKYMAYNKKLFADNGVAVPTTLEELLAACDTFKAKGIEPVAFGNQYGWPAIHYMTQLNPYFVPAATMATDYDQATGEFTDPGYQKALEAFVDLNTHCLTKGANGISHEIAQGNFVQGKSAMHYIEAVEFFAFTEKGGALADIANSWDFFKLPAPASPTGDVDYLEGAPDGFLVNPNSQHPDIAIDFLAFLTNAENAAKLVADLGWLSPIIGSATASNTFPQNVAVVDDINKAKGMAIWLDTVTQIDVANAYLNGAQALLDGTKTPAQVTDDIRAAAAKAKAESQ
jgi:raffinose/stachyose/melibiose transport system substrate-binding protein